MSATVTPAPTTGAGNGLAVAGFACAVVGAFLGLVPILGVVAIPLGILGLVFGLKGRRRARAGAPHKGLATWAVVLGPIAVLLGVLGMVIVDQAFDDLDEDLDRIEQESGQ